MNYYFMGIDGSGKTSILNDIEKRLQENNRETVRIWARYTPRFLKIFVNFFKKKAINNTGNHNTINAEEYSTWQRYKRKITRNKTVRITLFTAFFFDYYFQILSVYRKIRKNGNKIVLIDRFVIDFLVDQTVNFGDLSDTCIFRKLLKVCNTFDAVFFISVEPEIALERKNDIPGLDYLNERDKIYRNILKRLNTGNIIDNNGSRDFAVYEILKIIQK